MELTMSSLELKIPPPILSLLAALVMGIPALGGCTPLGLPLTGRSIAAAALMAAAAVTILSSGRRLFKAGTTWSPRETAKTTSLVMDGPYRFSRNPIYLGWLSALLAWGLLLNDWLALSLLPLFALYLARFQIIPEERVLEKLSATATGTISGEPAAGFKKVPTPAVLGDARSMPKLTVSILTLNEEEMLPAALASVAWADEIVVTDSGSTDRTVEVARAAGARVLFRKFDGYSTQFNWGFEQSENPWILSLDADEVVDDELAISIRETLASEPEYEVYNVVRDAFVLGRRMRSKAWSNERLPRLFKKGALVYSGLVHPTIEYGGRQVGLLKGRLLHYTYRDMEQFFLKFQQYTSLWAKNQHAGGRRVSLPIFVANSIWRFFHNYFLRREFLDGRHGFIFSILSMAYTFVKYIKLWDMNRLDDLRRKPASGSGGDAKAQNIERPWVHR
jgi:protein-S-isoprenylcysteine O-methyltransferase Ste14/glycosyltransferase involved in cell wall biosynthesis